MRFLGAGIRAQAFQVVEFGFASLGIRVPGCEDGEKVVVVEFGLLFECRCHLMIVVTVAVCL